MKGVSITQPGFNKVLYSEQGPMCGHWTSLGPQNQVCSSTKESPMPLPTPPSAGVCAREPPPQLASSEVQMVRPFPFGSPRRNLPSSPSEFSAGTCEFPEGRDQGDWFPCTKLLQPSARPSSEQALKTHHLGRLSINDHTQQFVWSQGSL